MTTQHRPSALPSEASAQALVQQRQAPAEPSSPPPNAGHPDPSTDPDTAASQFRLPTPNPEADYDYVHYILIGSPQGVEDAINRLHVGHRIERHRWTPAIALRQDGIRITPADGQVLRYLIRQTPARPIG